MDKKPQVQEDLGKWKLVGGIGSKRLMQILEIEDVARFLEENLFNSLGLIDANRNK